LNNKTILGVKLLIINKWEEFYYDFFETPFSYIKEIDIWWIDSFVWIDKYIFEYMFKKVKEELIFSV